MGSILWVLANEKPPLRSPLLSLKLRPPPGALANRPHLELLLFLHSKQQIKAMVALELCLIVISTEGGGGGKISAIGYYVTSKWLVVSRHVLGLHVLSHL